MRIGFLTNSLAEEAKRQKSQRFGTLESIAEWAAEKGFADLECGPSLPLDEEMYARVLDQGKIGITALIYCRNFLSTDQAEAGEHLAQLKKRIEFAGRLGIEKVVTSTGIDKSIEEGIYDRDPAVKDRGNMIRRIPVRSLDRFADTFGPIVELAEKCGVKLCFENCPLMGNIAISPAMWTLIFQRLDSKMVGLAYDPSHLVWEFMDPYGPVSEFGARIFHFHAKDTAIDRERLRKTGILTDFSWWTYRIPGRGEIDWSRMLGELKKMGYSGTVSIEHEDKDYEGTLEAVEKGIVASREFLSQYL